MGIDGAEHLWGHYGTIFMLSDWLHPLLFTCLMLLFPFWVKHNGSIIYSAFSAHLFRWKKILWLCCFNMLQISLWNEFMFVCRTDRWRRELIVYLNCCPPPDITEVHRDNIQPVAWSRSHRFPLLDVFCIVQERSSSVVTPTRKVPRSPSPATCRQI